MKKLLTITTLCILAVANCYADISSSDNACKDCVDNSQAAVSASSSSDAVASDSTRLERKKCPCGDNKEETLAFEASDESKTGELAYEGSAEAQSQEVALLNTDSSEDLA